MSTGPQAEWKTIVCVLGSPRCGTSLTTRLLNLCGLYVGENEDLVPPGPSNAAGVWELRRLARITERILAAMGGDNFSAPYLPRGWEHELDLEAEREEALALMIELFGDWQAWGWKDPRTSLTLPFWQELLPARMRYVICTRNPLDVAASARLFAAERGFQLSPRRGLELWQSYMSNAIVNTRGRPRTFVAYEEYFDDWRATVDRLARFAGLDPPAGTEREEVIGNLIDSGLRHHGNTMEEVEREGELPADAASLYSAIVDEAGEEELDRLASRLLAEPPATVRG